MDLGLQDVATLLKNHRIVMDVDAAAKYWPARHGYYGARAIACFVHSRLFCSCRLRRGFEKLSGTEIQPRSAYQ